MGYNKNPQPLNFLYRDTIKKDWFLGGFFFNLIAFLIVLLVFVVIGWGATQADQPISHLTLKPIDLHYSNLFAYSLRTCLRMFIALIFAIIFSLIYAKLCVINSYFEQILIPFLDVLQSIPILGFVSFTITVFLNLFPGNIIGAELAAIFAIFTSQAWNITFSFYQSLKNAPSDLIEVARMNKLSAWQKFWRIEVPYAIPALAWNMIISISSGWFFVIASEVITVGDNRITLPGIGSYIALAIDQGNKMAIIYAILTIIIVIFIYDRLFIKPLLLWADKFQYEGNNKIAVNTSLIFSLFQKDLLIKKIFLPISYIASYLLYQPLFNIIPITNRTLVKKPSRDIIRIIWYLTLLLSAIGIIWYIVAYLSAVIRIDDIKEVLLLTTITFLRVMIMIVIASLIWVPIGVYIGMRPALANNIQPIVQFLAAFPVNLLFPLCAFFIVKFNLNPNIWLTPLIIMGAQWYILFNVIVGTLSFPVELAEVVQNLKIRGKTWWLKIMLPAITPYFMSGVIAASGGAWNASIVAELINFNNHTIVAEGIGSYIAQKTILGDFKHIILGILSMSIFVILLNRLIWNPIYNFSLKKFQL